MVQFDQRHDRADVLARTPSLIGLPPPFRNQSFASCRYHEIVARYAAIDIGSNSIRMEAAEVKPGQPARILASDREVTRLGESVFRAGSVSEEAMEATCVVLARVAELYRKLDVAGVRAVATSAIRDARNQHEFIERASAAVGAPVEIISGREEARLIHLGVVSTWPQETRNLLIIDIGCGSAEIIAAEYGQQSVEGNAGHPQSVGPHNMSARIHPLCRSFLERRGQRTPLDAIPFLLQFAPPVALSLTRQCLALGASGFVNHASGKPKPIPVGTVLPSPVDHCLPAFFGGLPPFLAHLLRVALSYFAARAKLYKFQRAAQ